MKRTPLYDTHVASGARMVPFAGWEMPIQYAGIAPEHRAVRETCGLFDVSHMGEVRVRGVGATEFLSFATLNAPAKLAPGRGQYSMLPNDHGGLIDDLYVYRLADDDYLVVCNASNVERVVPHLADIARTYDVAVTDESDEWALVALQGPAAADLLGASFDVSELKKNRFRDGTIEGARVRVARTGYTGEDGFEIFCAPEHATRLWAVLTDGGAVPCGLGARDTLRLEAGFPLYGHELTDDTNPLCTDYAWVVKDKPFYGRDAMMPADCRRRLVGLELTERGVPREGYDVYADGDAVGRITSGTMSPTTRKGIAMAWLDARSTAQGTVLEVEIRGSRVAATVVKPPFYGD